MQISFDPNISLGGLASLFGVVALYFQNRSTKKKSEETHRQVTPSNGRTVAKTAEDTNRQIKELRGEVLNLYTKFGEHLAVSDARAKELGLEPEE